LTQAAEKLTPVTLELGGKDPMIVLADADLERAANAAVYYGMGNSGQTCISIERVYVEDAAYEPFVAKVVEKTRQLRQGVPGGAAQVEVGAMTFPPQVDLVEEHVNDAVERGATVLIGGHRRPGAGSFFEPTVLTGVDHTMKVMTDETFGPTLPIMRVRDDEEAVRLANDSRYGLDASVWTSDAEKGERIARRIESGAVCVNDAVVNYLAIEVPFGGMKESGIGTRHGAGGIRSTAAPQSVMVTRSHPSGGPLLPLHEAPLGAARRFVRLIYERRLR
jgi:acyl-CoA reductase-like NAD-dependent aldehyde dehydrogenase